MPHVRHHVANLMFGITWQASRLASRGKPHIRHHMASLMFGITWQASCSASHGKPRDAEQLPLKQ